MTLSTSTPLALRIATPAVLAIVLGSVVTGVLLAQGQQGVPVLDGISQQYQNASRLWRPRLVPIAQRMFMLLATLEFVISGALWAFRRDSLDDIAAKFLLKFTLVAFLLALITGHTFWLPPIINGFAAAGEQAAIHRDVVRRMDAVLASFPFTRPKTKEGATRLVEAYRSHSGGALGHMVGMEVHDPTVPYDELKPGMVFTIQPGSSFRTTTCWSGSRT